MDDVAIVDVKVESKVEEIDADVEMFDSYIGVIDEVFGFDIGIVGVNVLSIVLEFDL